MKKRSNFGCWLWAIGLVVGIPLLLLIVGILVFFGRERSARNELTKRLDRLVAQGLPVDDASLLEFNKSMTSSEDTRAWQGVFKQFESPEFKQSSKGVPLFDGLVEMNIPAPGEKWPQRIAGEELAAFSDDSDLGATDLDLQDQGFSAVEENVIVESEVRDFLANWSELHHKIAMLSLKQLEPEAKGVQFIAQFESLNTLLPCVQSLREAARLLSLRGQIALYDRDSKQVKNAIEALLGCSRTLQGEPILISQLVSIAIDGMAMELLKTGLEHDVLDEQELLALLPLFRAGVDIGPQWRIAIQGERAMGLPVFENPALAGDGAARIPARSRDALYFLDAMERVLKIPEDDFDSFLAALDAEEQKTDELVHGGILTMLDSVLTSLLTPAYRAAGSAFVRRAVQHRMAVTCIGIRLYEKRQGKLPAKLDDLISLQVDGTSFDLTTLLPAGGKPFGYRVDQQEAVVWGGNLRLDPATPAEPLPTAEGEPNADENKLWIWTLLRNSEASQ